MIKYKKLNKNEFHKIEDVVIDTLKLDDLKKSRDHYQKKYQETDALIKELEKLTK